MSEVINGTTKSGFTFEVNNDVMDDVDVLETLANSENENKTMLQRTASFFDFCALVLGKEQFKALKAHIRENQNGKAPVAVFRTEMEEIMASFGTNSKNSES